VILAGGGLYREPADRAGNILAAATASPIQSAKDFAGKTIGLPTLVGLTTACLRAWLPAHGVPLSSVRLTELPPASMVPALQRGTIDVALLSEPFVTLGKGDVRVVGYPFDVAADRSKNHEFCFSVWYASKAWVEQDRDRARRAVQAIYDGARWANSHRDETLDILIKNRKLDADKIQGMARVTFATSLTPDLISPVLEVANAQNVFSRPVTAESLIAKL
jgi:ABC-type nitrate/sulfonate/bicarbonate transport system substrate-binding protein